MQARLLERPQQVKSMNRRASRADPPRKPAVTKPSTYPPVDRVCNSPLVSFDAETKSEVSSFTAEKVPEVTSVYAGKVPGKMYQHTKS